MARPHHSDYPDNFAGYISKVSEDDLLQAFSNQLPAALQLFSSISEDQSGYTYAPGKWSIKEMLQHIIDAERIFCYRALCIARKESISLPPFDENEYAKNSFANQRRWMSLYDEFQHARQSTQDLFESFTVDMMEQRGVSNNKLLTVSSIGFTIVGHVYHHMQILRDKYIPLP